MFKKQYKIAFPFILGALLLTIIDLTLGPDMVYKYGFLFVIIPFVYVFYKLSS